MLCPLDNKEKHIIDGFFKPQILKPGTESCLLFNFSNWTNQ